MKRYRKLETHKVDEKKKNSRFNNLHTPIGISNTYLSTWIPNSHLVLAPKQFFSMGFSPIHNTYYNINLFTRFN